MGIKNIAILSIPVVLILLVPATPILSESGGISDESYVDSWMAQDAASQLIERVYDEAKLSGKDAFARWAEIRIGEPILIHDPNFIPKYYIVPAADPTTGEVVTRVGVNAETGEWQWYVEECLIKAFPPVSALEARGSTLRFLTERGLSSELGDPLCVSMPNRKLYWVFPVRKEEDVTHIYANFGDCAEILTNLEREELRSDMPSLNNSGSDVEQSLPPESLERSAPPSYDIEMMWYYQWTWYYCGVGCLDMQFDYYGPRINQYDIAHVANTTDTTGTWTSDMRRAAHFSELSTAIQDPELQGYPQRSLGCSAHQRRSANNWLAALKEVIASDHPITVLTWEDFTHVAGHYRVAKGYNDNLNEIIVHDPWNADLHGIYGGPNLHFSYPYFTDLWSYGSYWGLMVSPWSVSVVCPSTVTFGATFTVTADIEYTYDDHLVSTYDASDSYAEIELPSAYSLAPSETQAKPISVSSPGSSDTVMWDVIAPAAMSSDSIKVVAYGTITGSAHSYPSYTDRIGGEGSTDITVEPTFSTFWMKTYGGASNDFGCAAEQTSDGGYVVAGYTYSCGAGGSDVYLIKTNAHGDTVWTRTYGGLDYDEGASVEQTSDGGYAIAGRTYSFGAGSYDAYLIKTDADGDTLWTRTYGGANWDMARSVQQTSDGGYIVAGYTGSYGPGPANVYLIKTDADGDTLWTRTYGGLGEDMGRSVQQTSDGGYIIVGRVYSYEANDYDVYLVKTDVNGDTLWTRRYGGTNWDEGYSVQETSDGGYIVAGQIGFFLVQPDGYLVKTDADGDTLWTRTYGGANWDMARSVQQTSDGGYIVAGYTGSYGAGETDAYLIRTDGDGNALWTSTWGGTGEDVGFSVQETFDKGYVIAGYTRSYGAGGADVWLTKTDSLGVWDLCGDCNGDDRITVADATYLVSYIYREGSAPIGQGDVNLDTRVTVADATYIVSYIYRNGPPPCEPIMGGSPLRQRRIER